MALPDTLLGTVEGASSTVNRHMSGLDGAAGRDATAGGRRARGFVEYADFGTDDRTNQSVRREAPTGLRQTGADRRPVSAPTEGGLTDDVVQHRMSVAASTDACLSQVRSVKLVRREMSRWGGSPHCHTISPGTID